MQTRLHNFWVDQLPAMVWAILIFIASSIPAGKMPKLDILQYDKLIHGGIFFIFGLLLYRLVALRSLPANYRWIRLAVVLLVVMLYGAMDEFHQSFVPGRTVDFFDFLADTIGGILSILLLAIYSIRRDFPIKPEK